MDLNAMMSQVQEMQAQMAATQSSLADERVEATAGGGMVKVEMTGSKEVVALTIDPEVVDPADVEMLQDLIVAAFNEAARQADALAGERMGGVAGGLDLGGLDLGALGLGDIGNLLGGPT
jgi:DNA-binding YbaB/EbfC family protein